MKEPSLEDIDYKALLYRLTLYALGLSGCLRFAGLGLDEPVGKGGDGPKDFAQETIRRFIDPDDRSVTWKKEYGLPTQAKVEGFLKAVLRNDFLDQKKRPVFKKAKYKAVLGGNESGDGDGDGHGQDSSLDDFAAGLDGPLDKVVRAEQRAQLLRQVADDPAVREMLELQLEPDGYNAFTNQELADVLGTDVATVENTKKRAQRRLIRMLAEQNPGG